MAGLWSVIEPEATENLCYNPSFELGTTGYAAIAGVIAQSTDNPPRGLYNLKCTPAAGVDDGCYYLTVSLADATAHTYSLHFKGAVGIPYQAYFATVGAALKGTATEFTGDGAWHRYRVTWTTDAAAAFRLYVTKNNDADTDPFYVDAVQLEAKAYATTYVDGSLPAKIGFQTAGVYWAGEYHNSSSVRLGTSRMGGVVRDLQDYHLYISDMLGTTATGVRVIAKEYVQLPGALHDNTKVLPRTFALIGIIGLDDYDDLLESRAEVYKFIKPDLVRREPILIRYSGAGSKTLEIAAHYRQGLEGGALAGFSERVALRFQAMHPFWRDVIADE